MNTREEVACGSSSCRPPLSRLIGSGSVNSDVSFKIPGEWAAGVFAAEWLCTGGVSSSILAL